MLIRELRLDEKDKYNTVVDHPLQSWEWGQFRESTGVEILRLGLFAKTKLVSAYTITFHNIPKTSYKVGYMPKSKLPDKLFFSSLTEILSRKNCIFLKIEPDVKVAFADKDQLVKDKKYLAEMGCIKGKPMFTKYNFILDITGSEEELMTGMKQKTRYNTRLAIKKGVKVLEDNSDEAFAQYLQLTKETTKRQRFYAHTEEYHSKMWSFLKQAGIARLLRATGNNQTLASWILFKWGKTLYYPYGASSSTNRELMASNLMMWEAIKYGKKIGCTSFDMWGCLGPNPDPKDPWYGFHRFKEGYGPQLVETIDSWDYVVNLPAYNLYKIADKLRWQWLKLKALLP
jgi:lipid II:glycine glycyltransferase (peptidoglycan interpeptide bridge formation enzyme)